MTKLHAVVALLVAIVLPAWSWRDGSGWLAWTMFSGSQTYRLGVTVVDSDGGLHIVNPTALASQADADAALYLTGAERYRQAPIGPSFRANLPNLGALACRQVPRAVNATITLEVRNNLDAPAVKDTVRVRCS
jgi:hypothetical protein